MTPAAPDLAELLRQLAAIAGDAEPLRVVIERGGVRVELTAGPAASAAASPPAAPKLTEADRTILEAVAGLGEAPTGQEVARAAGYPYDSHLKTKLSLLRSRGLLGGARGEAGYPLTESGLAAAAGIVSGPAPRAAWASGPAPKHAPDFALVYWPGLGVFALSPKQAAVVRRLWEAREAGEPFVRQAALLDAAGSDCGRLLDLFRRSDAWGALVVAGASPATFTLPTSADSVDSPAPPG